MVVSRGRAESWRGSCFFLHKVLGASSGCVNKRVVDFLRDSSSLHTVKECSELEELCGAAITEL